MLKTEALDNVANAYVDKDVGLGTPGTRLEAADRNIIQDELVKQVESSGQALDPTGAIRDQLARALFIYGSSAQALIDTGGAGAYVVDHVTSGLVVPSAFSQIDGALAIFIPAVINPGASTLDYMGLGPKPITDRTGSALTGNEMSGYVSLQYNLTSDRWEFLFSQIARNIDFDDSVVGYVAATVQIALEEVVKRANHTDTQPVSTLSDHNKTVHDALNIDADTLDSNDSAFFRDANNLNAGILPAARFNNTAHGNRSGGSLHALVIAAGTAGFMSGTDKTKLDGLAGGAGSIGQTELKTAIGEVSRNGSSLNLTLPGGEYGFYPQIKLDSGGPDGIWAIGSNISTASYVTNINISTSGQTAFAQQRYVQSSPPYKIGDVGWGHFIYLLRNKSTKEIVASYEAQDPPWAYNGPNWLHKNDPELLVLIPHPFPDFGTELLPEADFEVVLVDLRDFDVSLWQYDNIGRGKTVLADLKEFAPIGAIKTRQQVGLPEIPGFTDTIKIRARQ